jgi:hypothetical protein
MLDVKTSRLECREHFGWREETQLAHLGRLRYAGAVSV